MYFLADLIRHQCFVVGVHTLILSAMDSYPEDEVLQEASIEALAVLGGVGKQTFFFPIAIYTPAE